MSKETSAAGRRIASARSAAASSSASTKSEIKKSAPTQSAVKPPARPAEPAEPAVKTRSKVVAPKRNIEAVSSKASKPGKPSPKKPKLVRDSFTFPENDYALFASLKQRALSAGREIKKSELLRAGLAALTAMSDGDLLATLDGVERIKTGRPSK